MNYHSRVDPEAVPNGWNQNPSSLALATNNDSNGIANLKRHRNHRIISETPLEADVQASGPYARPPSRQSIQINELSSVGSNTQFEKGCSKAQVNALDGVVTSACGDSSTIPRAIHSAHGLANGRIVVRKWLSDVAKFRKFIGPGFMVAVAYIDPGMLSSFSRISKAFEETNLTP